MLGLSLTVGLMDQRNEFFLEIVFEPTEGKTFFAGEATLLTRLESYKDIFLKLVVVHLLTNAVTEAFELAEAQDAVHEHVVLLKDVFDHELKEWVHVVVLGVVLVRVKEAHGLLLVLRGTVALVGFGFIWGCPEETAGGTRDYDVGASL